jgi:hypothetical protein
VPFWRLLSTEACDVTVFVKKIFVLQSASLRNAATVCFSYGLNSRLNDVVIESGGPLLPISF